MATDNKRVCLVLGVHHRIQGPRFCGYVVDRSYEVFLDGLMRDGVDFVFEEASGRSPSTAEKLSESILGTRRYLDVDPAANERPNYGIAEITGGGGPIDPCHSNDVYESALIEEQRKREELWLQRIRTQEFSKALVVVGLGHALSVAFRLVSKGIQVRDALWYIPYHKFCTGPHA